MLAQSSWAVHTGRVGLNECRLSSMLLTVDMYDMSGQPKFSFWDRVQYTKAPVGLYDFHRLKRRLSYGNASTSSLSGPCLRQFL